MANTCFVANPAAGGGRGRARGEAALRALNAGGLKLDVAWTCAPGHATELVAEAWARGVRRFVVGGGDGTVFEALNGLPIDAVGGASRAVFGFLPLGTGNSFLRDFGIDSADEAARRILAGTHRPIDVMRVAHADGTLLSLNLVSLGFSADAGARTNARYKALGTTGYVFGVLESLAFLRPDVVRYRVDGETWCESPMTLLSFCNSQYTGGAMHMAPGAEVDDGQLDVIHADAMGRAALLGAFPGLFRGAHVTRAGVHVLRGTGVEFDAAAVARDVLIDGEIRHLALRRIDVIPRAIEVIA